MMPVQVKREASSSRTLALGKRTVHETLRDAFVMIGGVQEEIVDEFDQLTAVALVRWVWLSYKQFSMNILS